MRGGGLEMAWTRELSFDGHQVDVGAPGAGARLGSRLEFENRLRTCTTRATVQWRRNVVLGRHRIYCGGRGIRADHGQVGHGRGRDRLGRPRLLAALGSRPNSRRRSGQRCRLVRKPAPMVGSMDSEKGEPVRRAMSDDLPVSVTTSGDDLERVFGD